MTSTYDSEARSQEPHRRTRDSLDAVAESTLGLINRAASQARDNIKGTYSTAQKLSINLEAAQARIQELEAACHHYQERSERAEGWLRQISSEIEQRFLSQRSIAPQRRG
jgi:DNA repair exonuclease SbcCD ATPase subunit